MEWYFLSDFKVDSKDFFYSNIFFFWKIEQLWNKFLIKLLIKWNLLSPAIWADLWVIIRNKYSNYLYIGEKNIHEKVNMSINYVGVNYYKNFFYNDIVTLSLIMLLQSNSILKIC